MKVLKVPEIYRKNEFFIKSVSVRFKTLKILISLRKNMDLGPKKNIFHILWGSGTPLKTWDLKFPIQFAKN